VKEIIRTAAVLLVLAVLATVAVLAASAPEAADVGAPEREFSAGRAAAHLERVARRPHPPGTAEHAAVREYVADTARELGALVTVETGEAVRTDDGSPFPTAEVHNVVATVPGTDGGGPALLLAVHYDSVPTGPGAADDGAGVAAMLETMRALRASGGVRNDVVFLFTDAEELGLLGAQAYVARNGVAGIGAVLNFEARGSRGPAWMFETGGGNGPLISAFAEVGGRPVANSLTDEVYRRLPNDTDFTIFREAGTTGLNSAFIDGLHDYHSVTDTPRRLSAASMQHHGATMLGLVRVLGDADLRDVRGGDTVYFDLFARVLVHYPAAWAVPLGLAGTLAVVLLVGYGVRRSRLRVSGVLAVAGVGLGAAVVAAAGCVGLWRLVLLLRPDLAALPLAEPYEGATFTVGFVAVAVAALLAATWLVRRRTSRDPAEVAAGGLVVLGVLLLAGAFTMPGVTFLLQWPLVAALPALWWALAGRRPVVLLTALAPAVAAVLFAPLVNNLLVALGIGMAAVAVVFAVLGGLVALPLLARLPRPGALAAAALAVAVAVLGVGVADSGFTADEPRPDALVYVRDTVEGRSLWLTGDPRPDGWTSRALGDAPGRTDAATYLPQFAGDTLLTAPAPEVELAMPTVELLSDATDGDTRTVRFRADTARGAWQLQVRLPAGPLRACTVAGERIDAATLAVHADDTGGVVFQHFGAAARGLELTCEVAAGTRLPVEVSDHTTGLPPEVAALVGPRPDHVLPVSYGIGPSDSSVVRRVVTV